MEHTKTPLNKAGIIVCRGCSEEFDARPDQEGICDKCYTDDQQAQRDFEADRECRLYRLLED